jgi:HK97 family phage major capsid protein
MPNTAADLIPMVYGAFSQFVIRDAGPMRMFRLEELYRATDQTGFVAFSRHDSETLQVGAIKRMTMAS